MCSIFWPAALLFLATTAFANVEVARQWTVGQAVNTTSGLVTGRPATLAGNELVSEYLSIPFAAPPVGELRWRPPQKYEAKGPIDASKWGPSCAQGNTAKIDEDCLTLNIWTKPQTGEGKKAVMLSIYGGGFNVGSSNTRYLIGSPLANLRDVVVVSMNYRLNIFGFPGAPGLKDQNLGMLDIRASVEWVRDNIAQFGGDPSRITLFGESGGGGATDYYAFAWPEDPIVHAFIPMSGSAWTRGIAVEDHGNEDAWYGVSQNLGCGGRDTKPEAILSCLRKQAFRDIVKHIRTGPRTPGKTFGPTFDEKIVFKDYDARAQKGLFAKLPTLTGNTHNEAGFFTLLKNISAEDIPRLNACFTCTAAKTARARHDHKVPVWRYRWFGDFANNRHKDGEGAYHGSELPFVFGTPKAKGEPDTAEGRAVTETMMDLWSGFAKDPLRGLDRFGVKRYEPEGEVDTLLLLGKGNSAALAFGKGVGEDGDCGAYEKSNDAIDVIMERSPANKGPSLLNPGKRPAEE